MPCWTIAEEDVMLEEMRETVAQIQKAGIRLEQLLGQHAAEQERVQQERRLQPIVDEINKRCRAAGWGWEARVLDDCGFWQIRVESSGSRMLIVEDSFADHARIGIYPEKQETGEIFTLGHGEPMLDSQSLPPERVAETVCLLIAFAEDD